MVVRANTSADDLKVGVVIDPILSEQQSINHKMVINSCASLGTNALLQSDVDILQCDNNEHPLQTTDGA